MLDPRQRRERDANMAYWLNAGWPQHVVARAFNLTARQVRNRVTQMKAATQREWNGPTLRGPN